MSPVGKVVTQFHLQTLERLDELHRVFTAAEFRLLHADLERIHRLEVRLHIAIGQRTRWVDLRQPYFRFVEKFLVLRRIEGAILNWDVPVDSDEAFDLIAERGKIG